MVETGWTNYIVAFSIFFASHMILIRPPVKPLLVQRLGSKGFQTGYSILSLLVLYWLIAAAQSAPYIPLWSWSEWQNWVPVVAMLPVCLILAFALGRPNPFSFGGYRNDAYDPGKPGLVKWFRHPILVALFLWSLAHTVPNGNLAHAVLFLVFALFAVLGMRIIDRRQQRTMGTRWLPLVIKTSKGSVVHSYSPLETGVRAALGLTGYIGLFHSHYLFAGVPPMT